MRSHQYGCDESHYPQPLCPPPPLKGFAPPPPPSKSPVLSENERKSCRKCRKSSLRTSKIQKFSGGGSRDPRTIHFSNFHFLPEVSFRSWPLHVDGPSIKRPWFKMRGLCKELTEGKIANIFIWRRKAITALCLVACNHDK